MSNRLEFATPPPGVLGDFEALQIETHFDKAPEELKSALASKLLNYKAFRAQFPKPLTPEEAATRGRNFNKLAGLAEDWEGTRKSLPPEEAEALRLQDTPDQEAAKRSAWNMAYLAHSTGREIIDTDDYHARRRAWATTHFGDIGTEDDAAFYGQAKASLLKQRDERDALYGSAAADETGANSRKASLISQVEEAAYKGQPMRTALVNWQRGNTGKAHYSPEKLGQYEALGAEVYQKMTADMAAARPVAEAAWTELRRDRGEEEGPANVRSIIPLMRELTPEQQALVMRLLKDKGEVEAAPKGFWEATGTKLARGTEMISTEGAEAVDLEQLIQARGEFKEGSQVRMGSAVEEVVVREAAERAESDFARLGFLRRPSRTLSAEEAKAWNAQIEQEITDSEISGQLRKAGADLVDPVKGGNWLRRKLWEPAVESVPLMASMMVPGAGILAVDMAARGYQGEEYRRLREVGMDPGEAMRTARISGLAKAGLDRLQAASLVGKLPGVSQVLKRMSLPTVGLAGFGVRFGTIAGEQTAIELAQDHFVPALVQDVMASRPDFDPKWGQVWKEAVAAAPDIFLGMLLISGGGAAYGAYAEGEQLKELTGSRAAMRLQGYTIEQIDEIQAAPLTQKGALLRKYLPQEAPTGQARTDLIRDALKLAQEERAKADESSAGLQSRALQAGVTISRTAEGWDVRDGEGNTTTHTEFGSAFASFRNAANESEVRRDEPFLAAIEEYSRGAIPGESFEVRKEGRSLAAALAAAEIEEDQNTIDAIWARVELERARRGKPDLMPEDLRVLGESKPDFAKATAEYAARVWDGADVLDLVEEKAHNDVNRWVREGRTTMAKLAEMIRAVEAATGDTYLRGEGDIAIHEAYADLARTYAAGQRRGGAVTKGARGQQATGARTLRGKLREARDQGAAPQVMKALSDTWEFFKGVLTQARRLGKAKAAGKLGDVEQFLTESVGLSEQRAHNEAVAEQAGVDTKAAAASPTYSLAKAVEGLTRPTDVVKSPTGADEWGRITPGISAEVRKQSGHEMENGPIVMRRGEHFSEHRGFGAVHVLAHEEDFQKVGLTADQAISGILAKPDALYYDAVRDRYTVLRLGRPRTLMVMEFRERKGEYSVVTSYPIKNPLWKPEGERIWKGVAEGGGKSADFPFTAPLADADRLSRSPENKANPGARFATDQTQGTDTTEQGGGQAPGPSMSLSSADYLEALAPQLQAKGKPPRERRAMYQRAQERIEGMARAIRFNDESAMGLQTQAAHIRGQEQKAETDALAAKQEAELETLRADQETEMGGAKEDKWTPDQKDALKVRHGRDMDKLKTRQKAEKQALADKHEAANTAAGQVGPTNRQEMLRALATLDAIRLQFPPEVRGKAMFADLAAAKSNEQRAKILAAEVERLDRALETHLRKEYRQEIEGIFKKAEAKRAAGEKAQGKIGVYGHRWFDRAQEQSLLSPDDADAEVAKWQAMLESGEVSDTMTEELRQRWGAEHVTNLDSALDQVNEELAIAQIIGATQWGTVGTSTTQSPLTAADYAAAAEELDAVYQNGRLEWLAELKRRREVDQQYRENVLLARLGGKADPGQVLAAKTDTPGQVAAGLVREALAWNHVIADIFGDDQGIRNWADDWERDAALQERAALEARTQSLARMLGQALGTTNTVSTQRALWELARPQPTRMVALPEASQLELAGIVLQWYEEGSQEWLTEHGFDENFQIAARRLLKPETLRIMAWVSEQMESDYGRINAVFSRINGVDLPRVKGYAGPRVSERGTQNEKSTLSPEGIAGGMSTGFTRTRVKKPAGQPVIDNLLSKFLAHSHHIEHYIAWAEPMRQMRNRLGHRDVAQTIQARKGPGARTEVSKRLSIFDKGGVVHANAQSYFGKHMVRMLSAQSSAALAFNIGTRVKQLPAMIQGLAERGDFRFLKSFGRALFGQAVINPPTMMTSQAMAGRQNDWGAQATAMQAMAGRKGRGNIGTVGINAAHQWGFANLGWFDAGFTSVGASAAYDAAWRDAKEMGVTDAQADEAAMLAATRTVDRTAQPNRLGQRSRWEIEAGTYGGLLFRFQTATRQLLAHEVYAFKNWKTNPARAARVFVLNHFIVPTIIQTVANLLKYPFSDKDDDEIWNFSDYLLAWGMGAFSGIMLIGPILESAAAHAKGYPPRMGTLPLNDMIEKAAREWNDNAEDFHVDFGMAVQLLGMAIGGDASAINSAAKIWDQAMAFKSRVLPSRTQQGEKQLRMEAADRKKAKEAATTEEMADQKATTARERKAAKIEAAAQRAGAQ